METQSLAATSIAGGFFSLREKLARSHNKKRLQTFETILFLFNS